MNRNPMEYSVMVCPKLTADGKIVWQGGCWHVVEGQYHWLDGRRMQSPEASAYRCKQWLQGKTPKA